MILLDTHILLWWQHEPTKLTAEYRSLLDTSEEQIAISTISCWEIAMLVRKSRIHLPTPYAERMQTILTDSDITLLDITMEVIEQLSGLPDSFHGDPADSIIATTALAHKAQLATMDRKLIEYGFLDILK
jgi:PIN domain nuclease of toxin-antitoxin system